MPSFCCFIFFAALRLLSFLPLSMRSCFSSFFLFPAAVVVRAVIITVVVAICCCCCCRSGFVLSVVVAVVVGATAAAVVVPFVVAVGHVMVAISFGIHMCVRDSA